MCNGTNSTDQAAAASGSAYACSITFCSEEQQGNCTETPLSCGGLKVTEIAAAVLSTAAVVGIIVGVVAFAALTGGSAYAAYTTMDDDSLSKVEVNPLYEASSTSSGTNVLHEA